VSSSLRLADLRGEADGWNDGERRYFPEAAASDRADGGGAAGCGAAYDAAFDRLETEDPGGDTQPPELAEYERLLVDVGNLIDRGVWPRHLHWTV